MPYLLILMALFFAWAAAAEPVAPRMQPQDFDLTPEPMPPQVPRQPSPDTGALNLTSEELLARPELLERALDSSITLNRVEAVKFLLPLYRKLPQRDPLLERYAEALLARAEGRQKIAVARYREMIADHPDLSPVRLQLAITLAEDRQNTAARDQFEKLRSEASLPEDIRKVIEAHLDHLQSQEAWSFELGFQYLQDKNINNAPAKREIAFGGGTLTLPEPQAAHGLGSNFSASKRHPVAPGWFMRLSGAINAQSYWDNPAFNDIRTRLAAGIAYGNARGEAALLPFYEKRRFSGKAFSSMSGLRIEGNHWITPRWQVLGAVEYGRKIHDERRFLDADVMMASMTLLFAAGPRQYGFAGVDFASEDARDRSDAYRRTGFRGGWGQEWGAGISSVIAAGSAQRNYQGPDFFNIVREDRESFAMLSLWHRNIYWLGVTPRLVLSHNRVRSNHFAYGYRKNAVTLEVNTRF